MYRGRVFRAGAAAWPDSRAVANISGRSSPAPSLTAITSGGVSEISSVLKKLGTKLTQERSELTIEIEGLQGLGWEGEGFTDSELAAVRGWLFGKATTIYGGSTEIQNNIIAKRVLDMLDHQ